MFWSEASKASKVSKVSKVSKASKARAKFTAITMKYEEISKI